MNEDKKWSAFSDTVTKKLCQASHHLSVGARVQFLQTTIYECAHSAFGHKAVVVPRQHVSNLNPKQRTIELVKRKNELLEQIQITSNPSEEVGLQTLLESTRSELRKLRKKGNRRKKRWLRNRQRRAFRADPYKCGKDILKPRVNTKLAIPKAKLDSILKSLHSDPTRDVPLPDLEGLPETPNILFSFNASKFLRKDFETILQSR